MVNTPLRIGAREMPNRIVFPPTCTFAFNPPDGSVSELLLTHYRQIAAGGAGLIVVESTFSDPIAPRGRLAAGQDRCIPGLRLLADACHSNGALAVVQVGHTGLEAMDYADVRDIPEGELDAILEEYYAGALRCCEAGFDGVEWHAPHHYLLNHLVYHGMTDKVAALTRRVREACPEDFIVAIRMGCNDPDLQASIEKAKMMQAAGAGYISVSYGLGEDMTAPEGFPYSELVYGAWQVRKQVDVPVFAVKDIRTLDAARGIIDAGYADGVCVCRAMLCDPDWYAKQLRGEALNPCLGCARCQWYTDGRKCPARKKYRPLN